MPTVKEYTERKERAIREIQKGIEEKAKAIAAGVKEIEKRMEKFKQEWYGS
jgi:hypothetical protein